MVESALIVALISLFGTGVILWTSRYSIIKEYLRWRHTPSISIKLEPGPEDLDEGGVRVGHRSDQDSEILMLQKEAGSDEVSIPIRYLSHSSDPDKPATFTILVENEGEFRVIVDGEFIVDPMVRHVSERGPNFPQEMNELVDPSPEKSALDPGEALLMGGPKLTYHWDKRLLGLEGAASFSFYIDEEMILPSSDPIHEFGAEVRIVPRVDATEFHIFGRRVPELVGEIRYASIGRKYRLTKNGDQ